MERSTPLFDQVVVVTGACCGAGRAVARAFGRSRARVALAGACEGRLLAAASEIRTWGAVARVGSVDRFLVDLERVDVWVNVAHERGGRRDTIVDETLAPLRALGGSIINVWTGAPSRYADGGRLGSDPRVLTRRLRPHAGAGEIHVSNIEANGAADEALASVVAAVAEVRARYFAARRPSEAAGACGAAPA